MAVMTQAVADSTLLPQGIDPDVELAMCKANPTYLIDTYGVIDNKTDQGDDPDRSDAATMPFRLWPAQLPVVWSIWQERQVIILKARQLGISWIVCAYVLWLCLFKPGRVVLMFSKGQPEANELIRRVKALYMRLPDWMRERLPKLTTDNTRELIWSNASNVKAMPATTSAGVSYTADLLVMDEAAKGQMRYNGSKLYTAAKPTIDAGGQIIILSTAEGLGGFFHGLWDKTAKRLNNFKAVFLPWWARPGRDWSWYQNVLADAEDPKTVPQEYPGNPIEAFVASGRLRFDAHWITNQAKNITAPVWESKLYVGVIPNIPGPLTIRKGWPSLNRIDLPHLWDIPRLQVFKLPIPGRKYLLAADVAEGKDVEGKNESDFCCGTLIDAETWEECASLHGRWEPDLFALYLMALSEPFNQCPIIVERNNHGHTVLATFKNHNLPIDRVGKGHDDWPGWLTNSVTKPLGVDLLAKALRLNLVSIRSLAGLTEMQYYMVLKNGSTGASPGYHDDFVSSWIVALSYLRHQQSRSRGGPAEVGGEALRYSYLLA